MIKFYSFFTIFSYLDDYGFVNGLFRRLMNKIVPEVPRKNTFEHLLSKKHSSQNIIEDLSLDQYLKDKTNFLGMIKELELSLKTLHNSVQSFTMDPKIISMFDQLNIAISDVQEFHQAINDALQKETKQIDKAIVAIESLSDTIRLLRKKKGRIGTSLLLTFKTKKVLKYLERMESLFELQADPYQKTSWENCIDEYINLTKSKNSIRNYIRENMDLLSLEIVEHTAQKGEYYIAWNNKQLKAFLLKSMKAGILIAIFAVAKIYMDTVKMDYLAQSLFYSLNYALCFVLVKSIGGIIATKQPAMTASSIIKHIDKNNNLQIESLHSIIEVFRNVSKSQIISFIGNILIALPLAYLIAQALFSFELTGDISEEKIRKLVTKSFPIEGGAIIYASIAGFYLALAGLISGYVDNKVIYTNLPYRLSQHKGLKHIFSETSLSKIAQYLEKKSGALAGNIGLGFLLGTAPLVQQIIGIPFDIRHIAFSSANFGFAISLEGFNNTEISYGVLGIFLIGLFNFTFSFFITLFLALKSRGIHLGNLLLIMLKCGADWIFHPKEYIPFLSKSKP